MLGIAHLVFSSNVGETGHVLIQRALYPVRLCSRWSLSPFWSLSLAQLAGACSLGSQALKREDGSEFLSSLPRRERQWLPIRVQVLGKCGEGGKCDGDRFITTRVLRSYPHPTTRSSLCAGPSHASLSPSSVFDLM